MARKHRGNLAVNLVYSRLPYVTGVIVEFIEEEKCMKNVDYEMPTVGTFWRLTNLGKNKVKIK
jgi:hypothetical protein